MSCCDMFGFFISRNCVGTGSPVTAISLTLIPVPFALHFTNAPGGRGTFAEAICIWIGAAFIWIGYFRQRSR